MNSILSGSGKDIHMEVPDIRRAFEVLETDNISNPFTQRTLENILEKNGLSIEILPEHASYKLSLAYIANHISLNEPNILDHAVIAMLVSLLVRKHTELHSFDNLSEQAIILHNITSAALSSGNTTPCMINWMDFKRYMPHNIG